MSVTLSARTLRLRALRLPLYPVSSAHRHRRRNVARDGPVRHSHSGPPSARATHPLPHPSKGSTWPAPLIPRACFSSSWIAERGILGGCAAACPGGADRRASHWARRTTTRPCSQHVHTPRVYIHTHTHASQSLRRRPLTRLRHRPSLRCLHACCSTRTRSYSRSCLAQCRRLASRTEAIDNPW